MSEVEVAVTLSAPEGLPPPPPPPPPRNDSLTVEHSAEPESATAASIDDLDNLMADLNMSRAPQSAPPPPPPEEPPTPAHEEHIAPPPPAPETHVTVTVNTSSSKKPDLAHVDVSGKAAMFEKKGNPPPPPNQQRSVAPPAASSSSSSSHSHHHTPAHSAPAHKPHSARENLSGIKKGDTCHRCHEGITGDFVALHGKGYHNRCFTCADCQQPLGSGAFYDLGGDRRSCENCWRNGHAQKCHSCSGPIVGEITSAMGHKYHPQHFVCATCNRPFPNNSFYEHNGRPYCDQHFANLTGTMCAECNQPISGEVTKALGKAYHPSHFCCTVCRTPLHDYHNVDNKPYCAKHFTEKRGDTCSGCGQHTGTTTVSALNKKWHPECFSCRGCGMKLGTSFYDHNGNPFCKTCAEKQ